MMSILFGICLIFGILCLFYYGIITVYAGAGTAFAWFWICAGIGLIILGFVIRYIIKHEIKIPDLIRYLIIVVISAGICIFVILEGILIFYSSKEADPHADYLIVLGAQVRGTTITKSLKKRLDTALDYLEDNPKTLVIVSGGKGAGEDISEAEAMQGYLLSKGITKDRIILEDKSTNTNENIRFSKLLMKDQNASVAVVTNGFHIFRSISIAKKQGLPQIQGLAAPSDRILTINYYVREAVGVLKDFVFGNI
ncbi:MAG TPA: YdcF family protein [Mobilitalea sp.]|nr:YdcF family protein [Mobilitalea sp.]